MGPPVVFLHGLFGALSNWDALAKKLADRYMLWAPILPITQPQSPTPPTLEGLVDYVEAFVEAAALHPAVYVGNSLGGHIALLWALRRPDKVQALVLTGSSGLYENTEGTTFPRRSSYAYIEEKVRYTFYDPETATPELIRQVYELVNNNAIALRILKIARQAQRHQMHTQLPQISLPTYLIWGLNDTITPPWVAYEFYRLLPNAELHFIDRCGHAPMMENPERFSTLMEYFLQSIYYDLHPA
ncbi:MAG: alpha/beta fold hydrolase [Bacteroidia bacterium]